MKPVILKIFLALLCVQMLIACTTTKPQVEEPATKYRFLDETVNMVDEKYEQSSFYQSSNVIYRSFSTLRDESNQIQILSNISYHLYNMTDDGQVDSTTSIKVMSKFSYIVDGIYNEAYWESRFNIDTAISLDFELRYPHEFVSGKYVFDTKELILEKEATMPEELKQAFLNEINRLFEEDVEQLRQLDEEISAYLEQNVEEILVSQDIPQLLATRSHQYHDYPDNVWIDGSNSVEMMLDKEFELYKEPLQEYFAFAIGSDREFRNIDEMEITPYVILGFIYKNKKFYRPEDQTTSSRTFIGKHGETIVDENTQEAYRAMLYEEDLYQLMDEVIGFHQPVTSDLKPYYWYQSPVIFVSLPEGDSRANSSFYSAGPNFSITEIQETDDKLLVSGYRYYTKGYWMIGKNGATLYRGDVDIRSFVSEHKHYLDKWQYTLQKQSDGRYRLQSGLRIK